MIDPTFVALSLLPIHVWRDVGRRLRADEPPGVALDRVLADRWPDEPDRRSDLLARAAAAIIRGADRGLEPVAWSDVSYPPALAAIVDPSPV